MSSYLPVKSGNRNAGYATRQAVTRVKALPENKICRLHSLDVLPLLIYVKSKKAGHNIATQYDHSTELLSCFKR